MKALIKPSFLLFSLVLTIYVMRHSDISIGSMIRRTLQEYRPSQSLCTGTSLDQVFTQSEIDRAQSFKESLQGMRGGNPMMKLLTEEKIEAQAFLDYFLGALAFIVPWAAMFIISIISAIVITCNWCCIYGCCKKAKCCKCCKEPKDSSKKRIYIFITAIFALAGIGSGIAGLVISPGVPKGIELTMCSAIAVIEDLTYGVPTDHWLGVEGAIRSIDDLLSQFDSLTTSLTQSSASTTDVEDTRDDVYTQLSTMATNLNVAPNNAVPRADPNQGGTYVPYYMKDITNVNDKTTMTGMIREEVEIRADIIITAQTDINSAIDDIQNDSADIKNLIINARSDVQGISTTFQDALRSVNDFGSIGKTVITGIGAGLTAIFAAALTFSIFAVGAMILVGLLKMKSFNKFLHSSWMGFTLMSIFGFLLSTILYPLSLVLMETCDVVQQAFDKDSGEATMAKLTGNVAAGEVGDILNLCMFGDGDIIKQFGLDNTLTVFKTINDQFEAIEGDMPFDGSVPPSLTLELQDKMIADYKSGKWPDSGETITDLVSLNSLVDGCTSSDTWLLNSANCTANDGDKFASSSTSTFNVGNPTCIGLNVWTPPGHSALNRYSCSDKTNIQTFVTSFKSNRGTVDTVFTNVRAELDDVQDKYDDFATATQAVIQGVLDIKTDLASVEASLFDDNTGVFRNMNCKFVGNGLRRFADSMCVGFIASLYQASVVIIISSVMSFFGAIFAFCLAKRFILADPNTKPKPI